MYEVMEISTIQKPSGFHTTAASSTPGTGAESESVNACALIEVVLRNDVRKGKV